MESTEETETNLCAVAQICFIFESWIEEDIALLSIHLFLHGRVLPSSRVFNLALANNLIDNDGMFLDEKNLQMATTFDTIRREVDRIKKEREACSTP